MRKKVKVEVEKYKMSCPLCGKESLYDEEEDIEEYNEWCLESEFYDIGGTLQCKDICEDCSSKLYECTICSESYVGKPVLKDGLYKRILKANILDDILHEVYLCPKCTKELCEGISEVFKNEQ